MDSFTKKLKWVILYNRIWGSYPVCFSDSEIKPSTFFRILNACAAISLTIFAITVNYDNSDDGVLRIVAELVSAAAVLGSTSAWLALSIKTETLCSIFKNFTKIDKIFEKNNININYRGYLLGILIWNIIFHGVIILVVFLEFVVPLWSLSGFKRWAIVQVYFTFLTQIMGNVAILIMTAALRFRFINIELMKMKKSFETDGAAKEVSKNIFMNIEF